MLTKMKAALKGGGGKLVFTEGSDPRIIEAAARLREEDLLIPILLGEEATIREEASKLNCSLESVEVIDPLEYGDMEAMVEEMAELRKDKMDFEECKEALKRTNYFGTMLVKMGLADGLLAGAVYSTADTVRPALQLIKTRPGSRIVSSCFIMAKENSDGTMSKYAMGDCAINIEPGEDDLVEIAAETARTARVFDIEPKVAMLSYSTKGSGKGEDVDKVRNAAEKLKAMDLDFAVDGELQFDAAFSPVVAKTKAKDSPVAGHANTFIFPSIESGNIGYKMVQWLGGYAAYGPIIQGLNAPINDLSRGCNVDDVYTMSIVTLSMR